MKRILFLITALFVATSALAQETRTNAALSLMRLGIPAAPAEQIAKMSSGETVFNNNNWLEFRNAAGSGNINVLKVDGSDETILNADTGDTILLQIAGTTEATLKDDELEFAAASKIDTTTSLDLQVGGTSEIQLTATGFIPVANSDIDLGSAALSYEDIFTEKILVDNDSTSAPDADVTTATTATPLLTLVGAGATQSHMAFVQNIASAQGNRLDFFKTRAAAGSTNANTVISSGDDIVAITAWAADSADYQTAARILMESGGGSSAGDTPGQIILQTTADSAATLTTALTIESDQDLLMTGDLYLADGQNLGFTAASSANAACDTTCTTGCVIGYDTGGSAFVACSSAAADTCVCTK